MPLTVDACKIIEKFGGGSIFWRRYGTITDVYPQSWCLVDRLTAPGYIIVFVPALLGGRGTTQLYYFACSPKLRGRRIMSVAEKKAEREVDANGEELKLIEEK